MTDADRKRLAAILGMLGSDHAGERDNAARQAEAFRREHNKTWDDLLVRVIKIPKPPPVAPAPEPQGQEPASSSPPPVSEPASSQFVQWPPPKSQRIQWHIVLLVAFGGAALLMLH